MHPPLNGGFHALLVFLITKNSRPWSPTHMPPPATPAPRRASKTAIPAAQAVTRAIPAAPAVTRAYGLRHTHRRPASHTVPSPALVVHGTAHEAHMPPPPHQTDPVTLTITHFHTTFLLQRGKNCQPKLDLDILRQRKARCEGSRHLEVRPQCSFAVQAPL